MSDRNREREWRPIYWDGRQAYMDGKSEDNNPYGKGMMMERCAWAAGWHEKRREVDSEAK